MYYGLKLFKLYSDQFIPVSASTSWDDLYAFVSKFNIFFDRAKKLINVTLSQSYRDMLTREEGTAFSLPRDVRVWESVKRKFEDNLALVKEMDVAS